MIPVKETGESLTSYLKECIDNDFYFEIGIENAQILYDYITALRSAIEDRIK